MWIQKTGPPKVHGGKAACVESISACIVVCFCVPSLGVLDAAASPFRGHFTQFVPTTPNCVRKLEFLPQLAATGDGGGTTG